MKKKKTYSYPMGCIVKDENEKTIITVITQLYQIGIYVAIYYNSDPIPQQLSVQPNQINKFMKQFEASNLKIKNPKVTFGAIKKVTTDDNGLWVAV